MPLSISYFLLFCLTGVIKLVQANIANFWQILDTIKEIQTKHTLCMHVTTLLHIKALHLNKRKKN